MKYMECKPGNHNPMSICENCPVRDNCPAQEKRYAKNMDVNKAQIETKHSEKPSLEFVWNHRLGLIAQAKKLKAEGDRTYAEGSRLWNEGDRLREYGYNLDTGGDRLWEEAVLAVYGGIKMEWIPSGDGYDCRLENGEVFKYKE